MKRLLTLLLLVAISCTTLFAQRRSESITLSYEGIPLTYKYTYIVDEEGNELCDGPVSSIQNKKHRHGGISGKYNYSLKANNKQGKMDGPISVTFQLSLTEYGYTSNGIFTFSAAASNGEFDGAVSLSSKLDGEEKCWLRASFNDGKYTGNYSAFDGEVVCTGAFDDEGRAHGKWRYGEWSEIYYHGFVQRSDYGSVTYTDENRELLDKFIAGEYTEEDLFNEGIIIKGSSNPTSMTAEILELYDMYLPLYCDAFGELNTEPSSCYEIKIINLVTEEYVEQSIAKSKVGDDPQKVEHDKELNLDYISVGVTSRLYFGNEISKEEYYTRFKAHQQRLIEEEAIAYIPTLEKRLMEHYKFYDCEIEFREASVSSMSYSVTYKYATSNYTLRKLSSEDRKRAESRRYESFKADVVVSRYYSMTIDIENKTRIPDIYDRVDEAREAYSAAVDEFNRIADETLVELPESRLSAWKKQRVAITEYLSEPIETNHDDPQSTIELLDAKRVEIEAHSSYITKLANVLKLDDQIFVAKHFKMIASPYKTFFRQECVAWNAEYDCAMLDYYIAKLEATLCFLNNLEQIYLNDEEFKESGKAVKSLYKLYKSFLKSADMSWSEEVDNRKLEDVLAVQSGCAEVFARNDSKMVNKRIKREKLTDIRLVIDLYTK